MNDADRDQLRRVFWIELGGPPPGAEQRVLGGLDYARPARREGRWLGAVAVVLAALVVVALVGTRALTGRTPLPIPGEQPAPSATAAPFPCDLPIERRGVGEFVAVSAGAPPQVQASADPASSPRLPDGEGAAGLTYSWQLGRWLPVVPDWVSPDGARYAYSDRQAVLHVVRTDGSQDRAVNRDRTWAVIAFRREGVYVSALSASATPDGLWLVDPDTGRARQLQKGGSWVAASAGAAWELTLTSPAPPPPQFPRPGEVTGNVLVRLDLATGRTTPMYTSQASRLLFVGVDAEGDALVSDARVPSALLVVSAPGRVTTELAGDWTGAVVDGDRTWLADSYSSSVVLKSGGAVTGLFQVDPGAGGFTRIAGPCRPRTGGPTPARPLLPAPTAPYRTLPLRVK